MRVLIVRHGIALDRELARQQRLVDSARALTPQGRRKMRGVARGVAQWVPAVDIIATSPLVRAVETAQLLHRRLRSAKPVTCSALRPGHTVASLPRWLKQQNADATVLIVGHEPDLSMFIAWATVGRMRSYIKLKKGGACLLEFTGSIAKGGAEMQWLLTPDQLRTSGKRG